jgi:hypothetical protein
VDPPKAPHLADKAPRWGEPHRTKARRPEGGSMSAESDADLTQGMSKATWLLASPRGTIRPRIVEPRAPSKKGDIAARARLAARNDRAARALVSGRTPARAYKAPGARAKA